MKRSHRRPSAYAALPVAALLALAGSGAARAEEPSAAPAEPRPATGAGATDSVIGPPGAPPAETRRVVYLPDSARRQLRDELRREVLEQARLEGWAAPGLVPAWLARIRPYGDVRLRLERELFGASNASAGEFPDFNAINGGKAFDVNFNDVANERYLNVSASRTRPRVRARLGLEAAPTRNLTAGLRLTTGDSSSPVSGNQTLGSGFGKAQAWFDQAYLTWRSAEQEPGLTVQAGRFASPFYATELIWNDSLGMDGLAVRFAGPGGPLAPFLVGGAFPLYTTPLAWPAEQTGKYRSHDKWLFGGQLGADLWRGAPVSVRLAAAYYHFQGVQGRISSPCRTELKDLSCDTDDSRPSYAQRGNTYLALRTPAPESVAAEALGGSQYQYFGLASAFRVLTATGRLEAALGPALRVTAEGEYARNLALSRTRMPGPPLNNLGACGAASCPWAGSGQAFLARLRLGSAEPLKPGGWSAEVGYRRVGSDAVVDAFNDSDFGLGGTNLKGTSATLGATILEGTTLSLRWFSSDALAGPTYAVDVVQLDLAARF